MLGSLDLSATDFTDMSVSGSWWSSGSPGTKPAWTTIKASWPGGFDFHSVRSCRLLGFSSSLMSPTRRIRGQDSSHSASGSVSERASDCSSASNASTGWFSTYSFGGGRWLCSSLSSRAPITFCRCRLRRTRSSISPRTHDALFWRAKLMTELEYGAPPIMPPVKTRWSLVALNLIDASSWITVRTKERKS